MSAELSLIVCGASGRMGQKFVELCSQTPGVRVIGTCGRGEAIESKLPNGEIRPVVIDFSSHEALHEHAGAAERLGLPYLAGMTGLSDDHRVQLSTIAKSIPVLVAPNTSLGANLLTVLSRIAARVLADADIEICETHHRNKKDAPSGLAMQLANCVTEARRLKLSEAACFDRHGHGARKPGEIGVFGLRGGDVVGTHTVHLFDNGETLELTHRATDRRIFAEGALLATHFLAKQPAGLYTMLDVLKLSSLS